MVTFFVSYVTPGVYRCYRIFCLTYTLLFKWRKHVILRNYYQIISAGNLLQINLQTEYIHFVNLFISSHRMTFPNYIPFLITGSPNAPRLKAKTFVFPFCAS